MITYLRLGYMGQLGNQMLQYAMLRGVAAKTGFEVCLPKRFSGFPKKKGLIELGRFKIRYKPLPPKRKFKGYKEKSSRFDPAVFRVDDYTSFYGHFFSITLGRLIINS